MNKLPSYSSLASLSEEKAALYESLQAFQSNGFFLRCSDTPEGLLVCDLPRRGGDLSGAEAALEKILPPAGSRDFFRVTLTGSGEADIAKLTRRFSAVPNLTLRDETLPPLDIWGDTDADTLEGVYFRLLREAMEADPDSREEIQLAAEISRKLLEGREVTL